ncbi:MAG: DUF6494 family protein, partial [Rhodospirillales bacterium]
MVGKPQMISKARSLYERTRETSMDEDVFNMQVRKFLKNVGVTSQR